MRRRFFLIAFLFLTGGIVLLAPLGSSQAPQQPPPPRAGGTAPPPGQVPQVPAPQASAPPARPALGVVVLDPAHGGADAGARGTSGILESEVVMVFARAVREQLERQGVRVILTRQGNENPSFDDRSAVANGLRGALFISLHVSSTGPAGTARVYSLEPTGAFAERSGLILWDRAQEHWAMSSRRLAELTQIQLAQRFHGSPDIPLVAPVRQLRTIAAPAIAVELSSVSVPDRKQLDDAAPMLAEAIAHGVAAFRQSAESGGK